MMGLGNRRSNNGNAGSRNEDPAEVQAGSQVVDPDGHDRKRAARRRQMTGSSFGTQGLLRMTLLGLNDRDLILVSSGGTVPMNIRVGTLP